MRLDTTMRVDKETLATLKQVAPGGNVVNFLRSIAAEQKPVTADEIVTNLNVLQKVFGNRISKLEREITRLQKETKKLSAVAVNNNSGLNKVFWAVGALAEAMQEAYPDIQPLWSNRDKAYLRRLPFYDFEETENDVIITQRDTSQLIPEGMDDYNTDNAKHIRGVNNKLRRMRQKKDNA
ncbi:MAG: hypothetical protein ACYS1A_17835 [Planctomycetota bacterium]